MNDLNISLANRWFELWSSGNLKIADEIIDRWGAFCFYDIFTDLGLAPPWWQLRAENEITYGSWSRL